MKTTLKAQQKLDLVKAHRNGVKSGKYDSIYRLNWLKDEFAGDEKALKVLDKAINEIKEGDNE